MCIQRLYWDALAGRRTANVARVPVPTWRLKSHRSPDRSSRNCSDFPFHRCQSHPPGWWSTCVTNSSESMWSARYLGYLSSQIVCTDLICLIIEVPAQLIHLYRSHPSDYWSFWVANSSVPISSVWLFKYLSDQLVCTELIRLIFEVPQWPTHLYWSHLSEYWRSGVSQMWMQYLK